MKLNKKGFSLIEMLIAMAILLTLLAILSPTLLQMIEKSREKSDRAAVNNIEITMQMAAQHNSIYKNARRAAEQLKDESVVFVYDVDANDMLVFDHFEAEDETGEIPIREESNFVPDSDLDKLKNQVIDFKDDVIQYINSNVEPIKFESKYYKAKEYRFTVRFPDVDFRVDVETEIVKK